MIGFYWTMMINNPDIPYDPIVVRDKDSNELFRIDSEGNVYHMGRLVGTDEELVQATKDFIKTWTKSINEYQLARLEDAEEFDRKRNYQYLNDIVSNQG